MVSKEQYEEAKRRWYELKDCRTCASEVVEFDALSNLIATYESTTTGSSARYEYQGELQSELVEKIHVALKELKPNNYYMFASDMFELILMGVVNAPSLGHDKTLEIINSRAGQYVNSYLEKPISSYPEHLQKELKLVRED